MRNPLAKSTVDIERGTIFKRVVKEGLIWLGDLEKTFGNIELVSSVVIKILLYREIAFTKCLRWNQAP